MSADLAMPVQQRSPVAESLAEAIATGGTWSPDYFATWLAGREQRGSSVPPELDATELADLFMAAASDGRAPRGVYAEHLVIRGLLDLRRLRLPKPVTMRHCIIDGGIALDHACLGPLDLSASAFPFLSAVGAHIDGDLLLENLEQTEWIELRRARIAGQLDLAGSTLNPEKKGLGQLERKALMRRVDQALNCYAVEVGNAVVLSNGFVAYGEVNFLGASIGTAMVANGARFINPDGCALFCAGMKLDGTVALLGASAHGEVGFLAAKIGGSINCAGGSFIAEPGVGSPYGFTYAALNFMGAQIGEQLVLTQQKNPISSLCLRTARVGRLTDDPTGWPEKGYLELDGFTYEGLGGFPGVAGGLSDTPLDHQSRRDWLERQVQADLEGAFKPQPWTQCAKVLTALGRTHDARMILYERERHWLRSRQQHGVTRFFYRFLLGPLSGYGYKNHYALMWALSIWLVGALIFGAADRAGMIRPASEHVVLEEEYKHTGLPPEDYEPLNPAFYSADLLLPIVDIGQERYWIPRNGGERHKDAATSFPSLSAPVARSLTWAVSGWLPKAYYYFEIAMGWLLVSIVIAGFSKLLGHPQEE